MKHGSVMSGEEINLTEMQIAMRLAEVETIEEAKKYLRMLFPKMTEAEVQKKAEEIISIQ